MPKTPKQMVKYLKKNGFIVVSQCGSHIKMRNPSTGRTTIVPNHKGDMRIGTERIVLKQAGLWKEKKK